MSKNKKIYGIDLGTTYSCIAYVDEHGKPIILSNAEGQQTTPSVVYFQSKDNIVVGQTAKDIAEMYPFHVISTVKRVMGDTDWIFEFEDNCYHPQDISSFILQKLAHDTESITGEKVTDVVITCPAYFGVNQREATKQAGILAGLNVHSVIPEPTAAAIAYGMEQEEEKVILVYDLGGGTFDITVMKINANEFTVICTGGDHQLGGKNWDEIIANWFAEEFSSQTGIPSDSLIDDLETWQELLTIAEKTKLALSSAEKYQQRIRYNGERVVVELSRDKFNELTKNLLNRTISLTHSILDVAREKGYDQIDECLLVGGSTYMPQVFEEINLNFSFNNIKQFDPNQAVAKGAALFGYKFLLNEEINTLIAEQLGENFDHSNEVPENIRTQVEETVAQKHGLALPGLQKLVRKEINNVTSKSFGIVVIHPETEQECVQNMIVVDEVVPIQVSQKFSTHEPHQTSAQLRCMENIERVGTGDTIDIDSCIEIGSAELVFTHPLPQNSPIEVTFSLTEDGLLTVFGKDLTTNQEVETSFKTSSILTDEEVAINQTRNLAIRVQ